MKFLVGICGLGKGHCNRQYEIIKNLILKGHKVRICTFKEGLTYFSPEKTTELANLQVYDVFVPMITYMHGKLFITDIIKKNIKNFIPGTIKNIKIAKQLKKEGYIPDVFITDYEPVTARIGYSFKKPVVSIDQQSKFIFMPNDDIRGFSCEEEKHRLSFFFPHLLRRYILSFYKIPVNKLPENNELIYPIVRKEIIDAFEIYKKSKHTQNTISVYFSTYINHTVSQSLEEMIEIFTKFPTFTFDIFSTDLYNKNTHKYSNIVIHKNNRDEFAKSLVYSQGVISTAGHTTITEAIYCKKPFFAIPLPTYDQNYCAKFISDNQIGISSDLITEENLREFLNNLNVYKANIDTCKNFVPQADTISYLINELEKIGMEQYKK